MGRRLVVHIGLMKSGTTYLQSVLAQNRDHLSREGIEVFATSHGAQTTAGVHRAAVGAAGRGKHHRLWQRLRTQLRESDSHTLLVSSEMFSHLPVEGAREVVEAVPEAEVTVLLTIRDQLRVLPAQWQTYVRNFGTSAFADYLAELTGDRRTRARHTFGRAQGLHRVLHTWEQAGPDSLVTVSVPRSGAPPEALWRRFSRGAGLESPVAESVDVGRVRPNESLGYESCEVLRLLNRHLGHLPGRRYRALMRPMAQRVMAPLADDQTRPTLDRSATAFAAQRNEQFRRMVTAPGREFVGELGDLPVPRGSKVPRWLRRTPRVAPPDPATVRQVAEAVVAYAAGEAGVEAGPLPGDLDGVIARGAELLLLRAA